LGGGKKGRLRAKERHRGMESERISFGQSNYALTIITEGVDVEWAQECQQWKRQKNKGFRTDCARRKSFICVQIARSLKVKEGNGTMRTTLGI